MIAVRLKRNPYCGYLRTGTEYWRNLILSLGYIPHIRGLHFRIYKTYPCLLASFCLFGWEVAVWILVEIFTRDLFPHLQQEKMNTTVIWWEWSGGCQNGLGIWTWNMVGM